MKSLQDEFLNKRISVPVALRDEAGRNTTKTTDVCGECRMIGPNHLLEIPLQVVIDRTPIQINDISQIKIIS